MTLTPSVERLFSAVKNSLSQTSSSLELNSSETDKILFSFYNKAAIYCNNLDENLTESNLSLLHEQLEILFKKLTEWGSTQAIPTLALDTFFQRLKREKKGKLQRIFFDRGKRLLERLVLNLLVLNLNEEKIDLNDRKQVLASLLANDGLEQCVDNCQLLFEHAVMKLEYISNSKLYFYGLVSDYITRLATETASNEEVLLPNSFQRILC